MTAVVVTKIKTNRYDLGLVVNGTLAELKALLPPAEVEYVVKQPTLEDVFLELVGAGSATENSR